VEREEDILLANLYVFNCFWKEFIGKLTIKFVASNTAANFNASLCEVIGYSYGRIIVVKKMRQYNIKKKFQFPFYPTDKKDWSSNLWSIFMFQEWHEQNKK
tara:strand:+ start:457 stop:759 length:303 start_codon:yes stop_codon:yes gene_type:complete